MTAPTARESALMALLEQTQAICGEFYDNAVTFRDLEGMLDRALARLRPTPPAAPATDAEKRIAALEAEVAQAELRGLTERMRLEAENARLTAALAEAVRLLRANVWQSAETVAWLGPCDHDVGECHCDTRRAMDDGCAFLAAHGGGK